MRHLSLVRRVSLDAGWRPEVAFDYKSLKAIAKTFCYCPIANSTVNRVGRRIGQVSVKNAAKSSIAHVVGKRMNARCRVATLPLTRRCVDAGDPDNVLYGLSSNRHRHRLPVVPEPQLSCSQPSVNAKFCVVCRFIDLNLESASPVNHQTAVARKSRSKLAFDIRRLSRFQQFIESAALKGCGRRPASFTPMPSEVGCCSGVSIDSGERDDEKRP